MLTRRILRINGTRTITTLLFNNTKRLTLLRRRILLRTITRQSRMFFQHFTSTRVRLQQRNLHYNTNNIIRGIKRRSSRVRTIRKRPLRVTRIGMGIRTGFYHFFMFFTRGKVRRQIINVRSNNTHHRHFTRTNGMNLYTFRVSLVRRNNGNYRIINRLVNRTTLFHMKVRRNFNALLFRLDAMTKILPLRRLVIRRLRSNSVRRRHRTRTGNRRRDRPNDKLLNPYSRRRGIRRRDRPKRGKRRRHLRQLRDALLIPTMRKVHGYYARSGIHDTRHSRTTKILPYFTNTRSYRPKMNVISHILRRRTRNTISRTNNRLVNGNSTGRLHHGGGMRRVRRSTLRVRG